MAGFFEKLRTWLGRGREVPPAPEGYHVFTREFDAEVDAAQLDMVLGTLSRDDQAALDKAWSVYCGALQGWRTEVHVAALEASNRIRAARSAEALSDATVTLLIDQSGSMKGQSMLLAAAATDVAREFLIHLGLSVEVLGFTTSSWQGGKSRAKWMRKGRPPHPGRLCDLLHIVYGEAEDSRASTGGYYLKPMLRPDLPKENIDGEAVCWAENRLKRREARHKLLLVISDGVPVDDSTLMQNSNAFLERHLLETVSRIEHEGLMAIGGIGIGFDVSRYYGQSSQIDMPNDLGHELISRLEAWILDWGKGNLDVKTALDFLSRDGGEEPPAEDRFPVQQR